LTATQCLQLLHEAGSLLLAFVLGWYAFKRMDTFFRIVFVQVSVWLFCYISSYVVTIFQKTYGLEQNNQWVMNIHMILETSILLFAASKQLKHRAERVFVATAYGVFLTVVILSLISKGPFIYFNNADVTECLIMTTVYTYILYRLIWKGESTRQNTAGIVLCIGLLIYFACSVPLIAMLHLMEKHDPETGSFLFYIINDVTANLRYLLTAVAFWLVGRTIHQN